MLLCDLPALQDVLDDIIVEETDVQDETDLYESIIELIDAYVLENPTEISEPDFEEVLYDELLDLLEMTLELEDYELEDTIEYAIEQYFTTICPPRSHSDTIILTHQIDIVKTQNQIDYLKSKPQPAQRTPAWYIFRRNLITASNAYKAFESQSSQNQLIYEKCKEDTPPQPITDERPKQINTTTSLHWGQKYEPVSVALYEYIYNTQVGDFGCIQHDTYSFIGASPDGINILQSSPRFGRMLEIKNVVSREIDGIPKKEYWIQMQLQMETCDLDECDFLETQFKEYETHIDFLLDDNAKYKGVILQMTTEEGGLKYIYSPVGLNLLDLEVWETCYINMNESYSWICTHYWKIEVISCVLVQRNRQWFSSNISGLAKLWDTVLEERVSGFEHRAPNKKQLSSDDDSIEVSECLFVMNENGKIM
jgi:putative phage-type endonuclease